MYYLSRILEIIGLLIFIRSFYSLIKTFIDLNYSFNNNFLEYYLSVFQNFGFLFYVFASILFIIGTIYNIFYRRFNPTKNINKMDGGRLKRKIKKL